MTSRWVLHPRPRRRRRAIRTPLPDGALGSPPPWGLGLGGSGTRIGGCELPLSGRSVGLEGSYVAAAVGMFLPFSAPPPPWGLGLDGSGTLIEVVSFRYRGVQRGFEGSCEASLGMVSISDER